MTSLEESDTLPIPTSAIVYDFVNQPIDRIHRSLQSMHKARTVTHPQGGYISSSEPA